MVKKDARFKFCNIYKLWFVKATLTLIQIKADSDFLM